MKRIISIILILIVLVQCLTGCSLIRTEIVKELTKEVNYTYYDKLSNTGERCAIMDDFIYYFSNESDGINGIYRMTTDGQDVELLIPCADIRRVTVYKDRMYYVGMEKVYKYDYGTPWLRYAIYESNDFEVGKRIEHQLETVADACFLPSGWIVGYDGYPNWGCPVVGERFFIEDNKVYYLHADDFVKYSTYFKTVVNDRGKFDWFINEYYHSDGDLSLIDVFDRSGESLQYDTQSYVFDKSNNELVLGEANPTGIGCIYHCISDDKLYLTDYNQYYSVNMSNQSVIKHSLEQNDPMVGYINTEHLIVKNNLTYAIANVWEDIFIRISQKAIIIDDVTGNKTEIISLTKRNHFIVYFDEKTIVTTQNGSIYKYSHDGKKITKKVLLVRSPNKDYTIDFAGDWMFVYLNDDHKTKGYRYPYNRLQCKINLVTNEVIENTVPMEFEQYKAYVVSD